MSDKIILRRFDDMHCHFRSGNVLKTVLPFTGMYAGRGIAMPNLRPRAILTAKDIIDYRDELSFTIERHPIPHLIGPTMLPPKIRVLKH